METRVATTRGGDRARGIRTGGAGDAARTIGEVDREKIRGADGDRSCMIVATDAVLEEADAIGCVGGGKTAGYTGHVSGEEGALFDGSAAPSCGVPGRASGASRDCGGVVSGDGGLSGRESTFNPSGALRARIKAHSWAVTASSSSIVRARSA
jgi:hypothetical protein